MICLSCFRFTLDTSVQPRFHVGYKDGKMLKAEDEKDDDAAEDEENAGGDDDAGDEEDENAEDGGEEEEEDEGWLVVFYVPSTARSFKPGAEQATRSN